MAIFNHPLLCAISILLQEPSPNTSSIRFYSMRISEQELYFVLSQGQAMKILKKANDDDLIILSDVDEIPNLNKLNLYNKKNFGVFSQRMFMYKINFLNLDENNWHGSKICLKKNLKSPQWLRNLKFKKYPFWRIDKPKNIQIIQDGGWHFAYLQSAENISKKISSFAHGEFNKEHLTDEVKIKDKIQKGEDIFERGFKIKKVSIDNTFPDYIQKNQDLLKNWIA